MEALDFQALRSKSPWTRGGHLGEKTEAEAELEEGKVELGNFEGNGAGFVGRAAEWVVVGLDKHYTRVGQEDIQLG